MSVAEQPRTIVDTSGASGKRHPLLHLLLGRPLATSEESEQRVGVAGGVPIFGLDALGSAAYGPEAALTVLIPLGIAGLSYMLPLTASIVVLLTIVYFSYRQTIEAYPGGAGSYTVARENLGARMGLLAGAALMVDYVLNVAVGISTGIGALVSAIPSLQAHTLSLCLAVLVLLTLVNLRGLRETGLVLMLPTYVFIGCMLAAIIIGLAKTMLSGGHPVPVAPPPRLHGAAAAVSAWLLLRAFASGCTAMTGVEAVSNGVQSFREPVVRTAQWTLTVIVALLVAFLAAIAVLVRAYHIGATAPGQAGYQSILSQLLAAVAGKGAFYFVAIGSILIVLALSANTSFAAFPRLCRAIAQHGYLPYGFTSRGRRLVYSYGVYALAALSGALLFFFGGITDRLIPLFAIGAFLSFTLSQAGMVAHWRKQRGHQARRRMIMNATGALATGLTVLVVAVAKFTEGAWVTILLIPCIIGVMYAVRHHYDRVNSEISRPSPIELDHLEDPLVVVPLDAWNKVTEKALRFAMTLSREIQVLHVDSGEEPASLVENWDEWVADPARRRKKPAPELVVIKSPYRYVVTPILNYLLDLERQNPGRQIAVVLSELVERRWYHYLLHNQRAEVLTALLMVGGDRRIAVINVPWYLNV